MFARADDVLGGVAFELLLAVFRVEVVAVSVVVDLGDGRGLLELLSTAGIERGHGTPPWRPPCLHCGLRRAPDNRPAAQGAATARRLAQTRCSGCGSSLTRLTT